VGNWNSGRRPQSPALVALRGNPSRRRQPSAAPTVDTVPPEFDEPPPEIVGNEIAVAEWRRTVPLLRKAAVIAVTDRNALIAYCASWAVYRRASDDVTKRGGVVRGYRKSLVRNPSVKVANDALMQCMRLWGELGLTPASRARLAKPVGPRTPPSKWADDL